MVPLILDADQAGLKHWMRYALRLAQTGRGRCAENPSVGCVVLNAQGALVGAARTGDGGRPHAEVRALAIAGGQARGGTAFVTLEPCNHEGETPPCTQALISAGIKRVFVGCKDPDPRVSGTGVLALQAAGLDLVEGLETEACRESLRGFLSRLEHGRPWVQLKLAASLDGMTALGNGQSKWITGSESRLDVHLDRADADAILVSAETLIQDQARLTVRLPGMACHSPRVVVLDGRGRLKMTDLNKRLKDPIHITASTVPLTEEGLDLAAVMRFLGEQGLNHLYCEAGGTLAAALLQARLVDELIWYRAPLLMGGDSRPALKALGLDRLENAPRLRRVSTYSVGRDVKEVFRPCSPD